MNTGIMAIQQSSIQPWLSVNNSEEAIAFYKAAFDAIETYRLDDPGGGIVVKLSVNGAEFWLSSEPGNIETNAKTPGSINVRLILIIPNPDEIFDKAIKAGAKEIFAVGEDHGWRLGRIEDPFGLHWEIGFEL